MWDQYVKRRSMESLMIFDQAIPNDGIYQEALSSLVKYKNQVLDKVLNQ